jgi:hypothetical protein
MKAKKVKAYRGTWSIKPVTRVKESAKVYNRKRVKANLDKI